jgi:hypothetical protein
VSPFSVSKPAAALGLLLLIDRGLVGLNDRVTEAIADWDHLCSDLAAAAPPGCRDVKVLNSPLWRTAEMPAVNIHGTAVALTRTLGDHHRVAVLAAIIDACLS